ncbi:hypothetical protein [Anaerosalibacter massiliensis]|uniref:hypothetical protein n=1 Tax=Anaerosalibacter massiliensis TaxID=1347392 RepID=UPI0005B25C15|nr:hypothetical protein [Anaerosalibacter massiliensis]
MGKFIEVHNTIIDVDSISKIEFISDDIYLGLFPRDKEGNILIDFIPFTFAQIELFTGEKVDLDVDLYHPEEGEEEGDWIKRNRMYINVSWTKLIDSLGDIEKITGYEYMELEV